MVYIYITILGFRPSLNIVNDPRLQAGSKGQNPRSVVFFSLLTLLWFGLGFGFGIGFILGKFVEIMTSPQKLSAEYNRGAE